MSVLNSTLRRKLLALVVVGGFLQASCVSASSDSGPVAVPRSAATTQPSTHGTYATALATASPSKRSTPTVPPKPTSTVLKSLNISGYLAGDHHGNMYTGSDVHTLGKLSPSGKLMACWGGLDWSAYRPD